MPRPKKKKLTKKQEKKKRKKLSSNHPSNLNYWKFVLQDKKAIKQFLERGDERQDSCIIRTLNYIHKYEKELFNEIDGKNLLTHFKGKENDKTKKLEEDL